MKLLLHSDVEREVENNTAVWAVMVTVAFLPLFKAGFDSHALYYCAAFLSFGLAVQFMTRPESTPDIRFDAPHLMLFALVLWGGASLFWSIYPMRSLIEVIQLSVYAMIFLAAANFSDSQYRKVMNMALGVAVALAILGVLEYVFIDVKRIVGTFTNPNPFGIYMVMAFMIVWGRYSYTGKRHYAAASVLLLTGVFLTGSRGSMLALILALPMTLVGLRGKALVIQLRNVVLALAAAYILSQGLYYLSLFMQTRILAGSRFIDTFLRSNSFAATSVKGRLAFWDVAVRLFKNEWFKGYGLGTYFSAYYVEYGGNEWYSRFAHNQYLQLAAELGISGFVLFVGFLAFAMLKPALIVIRAWKPDQNRYLLAGAVAFAIHMGMDFTWHFPAVTAIFVLLLAGLQGSGRWKVNHRVAAVALIAVFSLSVWQLTGETLALQAVKISGDHPQEALARLHQVNRIYPINPYTLSLESDWHIEASKTDSENESNHMLSALEYAKKAVAKAPLDARYIGKLGYVHLLMGNAPEAVLAYEEALEYTAYNPGSYLNLGQLFMLLDRTDDAVRTFEAYLPLADKALKRAPKEARLGILLNIARIHMNLIKLYEAQERLDMALDTYGSLEVLRASYPELDDALARE